MSNKTASKNLAAYFARKVERSTMVISKINFCFVRVAKIGCLFYSNKTFVELNHWVVELNPWFVKLNPWFVELNPWFVELNHWFVELIHWFVELNRIKEISNSLCEEKGWFAEKLFSFNIWHFCTTWVGPSFWRI